MKRFFIAMVAMLLILSFSCSAFASTIYVSDDWVLEKPDNDLWEIDTYIGADENVTVPAQYGVINLTKIGNHAFSNHETVKNVTVSAPIDTIGDYVFLNAAALVSVTFSESVLSIGEGVFSGTTALRSVNLEDTSITLVPVYAFLNSGIEEIALPETCTTIANNAFAQCDSLKKVTIPANVTGIGAEAFRSSENVVICAPYGSYAIEYAIEHEISYQYSDMKKVTFLRGDADGDGEITIIDATKIQRVRALFDDDPDGMIALRAKSGVEPELSIMDATRIQRKIALYNDPYGIGESVTVYVLNDGTIVDPESFSG